MGTTAQKLQATLNSKENIRQAINNKGVLVSTADPLNSYADKINQISGGALPPSSSLIGVIFIGATYPVTYRTDTVDNVYTYQSDDYNITITGLSGVATITNNGTKNVTVTFTTTSTTNAITLFNIETVKGTETYNFVGRFFYYGSIVLTNNCLAVVSLIEPSSGAGTLGTNFNFVESASLPVFSANTSSWNTYFSHQIVSFSFAKFNSTSIDSFFLRFAYSFNQPLKIPSNITSIGGIFLGSNHNFNQPLIIPSSVTSIANNFLTDCFSFNQPLELPVMTTSTSFFLSGCVSFNQPFIFPSSITSSIPSGFLSGCSSFNQPLIIPNGVTSTGSFLLGCTSFNQLITLPDTLTSIGAFFLSSCRRFNRPLIIPNSVTSIGDNFLQGLSTSSPMNFNQPLILPSNLTSIGANFLRHNFSFSHPLTIPSSVTSIGAVFMQNCYSLTNLIYNTSAVPATSNDNLSQIIDSKTSSTGTGIIVTGAGASELKTANPDRTLTPFRKLVLG